MAIRGLVSVNERQARKLSTLVNGDGSNAKIRSKSSSGDAISIEAKDGSTGTDRKKVKSKAFKCGDNLYWDSQGRLESSGGGGGGQPTVVRYVTNGAASIEYVTNISLSTSGTTLTLTFTKEASNVIEQTLLEPSE